MGAVTENRYHPSSGYTIVIVIAAIFLLPPSSIKVQVTLPPGPIQVGPETYTDSRVIKQISDSKNGDGHVSEM